MEPRKIILFLLFILLLIPQAWSAESKSGKNVLILFAMEPSTPAYQVLTDGIRSKLSKIYGDKLNLHFEYLDKEGYPDQIYPCEKFVLINQKYERINIDLLICIGVDIISHVKRCANSKILDLPAIAIDYDLADWGIPIDLKLNDKTAVIGIKPDILGTLNSAVNLFPGRHHLFVLSGTSKTDLMYLNITKEMISHLDRHIKVSYINNVSMDEALGIVHNLSDSSLIIIPGFNTDNKMVNYFNPEATRLISQAAKVPVFTISDMGFGEGSVGGYILSFNKIGLLVGDVALKILSGFNPSMVKVTENEYYEHLYDWRVLKRWNLTASKQIPKGSRVEFVQTNFFREYRWFISAGIVFLILQFLLILNLARFNRKQKLITRQLIETENKYRELVNEDRILRLSQLSASFSHELNQPLTAILSTAQAGLRFIESGKNDPELMKEILGNIVEDDKRTASILSSLRGMLKLEKREKEVIDLNLLIEETILIYTGESIRKNITFELITVDPPVYIMADKTQIEQVILNLIQNSIQSIENAGAKTRKIIISEKLDNNMVIVSVRDFGEGIPEMVREKIFKPFVTSKKEGTGIGLAISRSIIEDHRGKIWADNMPDGGAIFSFSLNIYNDEKLL